MASQDESVDIIPDSPQQRRPDWASDTSKNDCTSCGDPFTSFNRRHHCRQCGELFCGKCTTRKTALPLLHYDKPVRVCDCCYQITEIKHTKDDLKATQQIAELASIVKNHGNMLKQGLLSHILLILKQNFSITNGKLSKSSSLNELGDSVQEPSNRSKRSTLDMKEEILLYSSKAILSFSLSNHVTDSTVCSQLFVDALKSFFKLEIIQSLESTTLLQGSPIVQVQLNGCSIVTVLISNNEKNRTYLMPHIMKHVIILLEHSHSNPYLSKKAAEVLTEFCYDARFLEMEGLPPLITLGLSEDAELQSLFIKAIQTLSRKKEFHKRIIYDGALLPLISVLSHSQHIKVQIEASETLYNLAESEENSLKIAKEGVLYPIIDLLDVKEIPVNIKLIEWILKLLERLCKQANILPSFQKSQDLKQTLLTLLKKDIDMDVQIVLSRVLGLIM